MTDTPTPISDEQLAELRKILQGTDFAIVQKSRVRTLTASHVVAPQALARADAKMIEEQVFRQLAFAVVEELLDNGAMRQRIAPLVTVDGSRRYEVRLDVFMPDGSGPPGGLPQ